MKTQDVDGAPFATKALYLRRGERHELSDQWCDLQCTGASDSDQPLRAGSRLVVLAVEAVEQPPRRRQTGFVVGRDQRDGRRAQTSW